MIPQRIQAKRLNRAAISLLAAIAAYILIFVINLITEQIFYSPVGPAGFPIPLLATTALMNLAIALTLASAVIQLIRAKPWRATRQRIALWCMLPLLTILAAANLIPQGEMIYTAYHYQFVTQNYIRANYIVLNRVFMGHYGEILNAARHAIALAALILLLPPRIQFAQWTPRLQRALRLAAAPPLFAFWLLTLTATTWLVFEAEIMDAILNTGPETPAYIFWREARPLAAAIFNIALLAAGIWLLLNRRRLAASVHSPNHCAACAYPLDPTMHTCPECGLERAIITVPTQPVPRDHTAK